MGRRCLSLPLTSPAGRPSSSRHAARVPRTDRTDRAALHAPRPVSAGVAHRLSPRALAHRRAADARAERFSRRGRVRLSRRYSWRALRRVPRPRRNSQDRRERRRASIPRRRRARRDDTRGEARGAARALIQERLRRCTRPVWREHSARARALRRERYPRRRQVGDVRRGARHADAHRHQRSLRRRKGARRDPLRRHGCQAGPRQTHRLVPMGR